MLFVLSRLARYSVLLVKKKKKKKKLFEIALGIACYTQHTLLLWSLLSVVSSDNGIDAVILWAVCYLRAGEFTRDALATGMCLHWFM